MAETYADAIVKLEADHDRIEALFEKVDKADGDEKQRLGIRVAGLVKIHMALEEEFLYPALRGNGHDDKLTEGLVEHDTGKLIINDVLSPDTDADSFGPKLQVLGEQMEHHHKEEEQDGKGVFWMARNSDVDLKAMLKDMEAREAELRAQVADDDLPAANMNYVEVSEST